MSHNDYTKYAREIKMETPEIPVEPDVVEVNAVESEIPEPAIVTVTVEPEIAEEDPVAEPARMMGVVSGCARLNVRKAPKPRAEVICEIDCGTEIEIDEENSTVDFYKIFTASGIEGYCIKTYVTVSK